MKAITTITRGFLGLAVIPAILLAGGTASAAQIPYEVGDTLPSPSTPAFNIYTNVPFGVNNEADFVRVRPSTGNSIDNGTNGSRNALYQDTISAACNVNEMFDVRTYVHNGADADYNENGTGTAVAKNVKLAMTASLGKNGTTFPFSSTITSSNAATVTDAGKLNCTNNVRLEIVPGTVKAYNATQGWMDVTVDAVDGTISIGSRNMQSGDVWGCWDDRIQIVYTVKVVAIPVVATPIYRCELLTNTGLISDNKYGFKVDYTANNGAVLNDISYVYSDGTTEKAGVTTTHLFTNGDASKKVTATANFTVTGMNGVQSKSSDKCVYTVPVASIVTTPKVLPDTGAGSTIAIFGATSVIGAFIYRLRALRGLAK